METPLIKAQRWVDGHILQCGQKLVHFVRHAQGTHNVAGEQNYDNYQSEEWFDAPLTDVGKRQCDSLAAHTATGFSSAALLVVSPLTRTLQTATLCFPTLVGTAGAARIPWLAHECVREQTGFHPCDRRQRISEVSPLFPHVDFALVEAQEEEDPFYYSCGGAREPDINVAQRSRAFFEWLAARPEKEVVVVTHSAFLRHTFAYVLASGESGDDTHFANCEMRSYVVSL